MKKLLPFILCCMLAGCDKNHFQEIQQKKWAHEEMIVVTIEGCEYFEFGVFNSTPILTHKGNCSNPIHHIGDIIYDKKNKAK